MNWLASRWRSAPPPVIAALLALGALLLYARVGGHPFLSFDDTRYVTQNPVVQRGLTGEGIAWAFTTFHAANWHPLTWLSHMLDVQLFGMDAGSHHRVNAALHAANTGLLFLALVRMTGARGRSALVAALFAVHPLHVESVAWIAERKDVLSTLFGLLMLLAYARYAERPGRGRYAPVALLLALSLLSKPMWVTAPFLLLLLDLWPLQRLERSPLPHDPAGPALPKVPWRRLLLEKLPLLALAAASSAITLVAQERGGAMTATEAGLGSRLANAAVAYLRYLGKTLWPDPLAIHYPYAMNVVPAWVAAGAALLLAGITALALVRARRAPWLALGWLWFLGTLVPVIGIVQVGSQAMADRYTYLPLVGIFIALAWEGGRWVEAWRAAAPAAIASVAWLAVLASVAWRQEGYWASHVGLFRHALAVTADNALAHGALSEGLRAEGALDEALDHAREAVRLEPGSGRHWSNLGVSLMAMKRWAEARVALLQAVRIDPRNPEAWSSLGLVDLETGLPAEAEGAVREALRLAPANGQAWYRLALVQARLGLTAEAIQACREAVRLRPDSIAAWNQLAILLQGEGRADEAVAAFRSATRAQPDSFVSWRNLGVALAKTGRAAEAADSFREALRWKADDPDALHRLGLAELSQGRRAEALRIAARLDAADPGRAAALRAAAGAAP